MLFRHSLLRFAIALRMEAAPKPQFVKTLREPRKRSVFVKREDAGGIPARRNEIVWNAVPRKELSASINDRQNWSIPSSMRLLVLLKEKPELQSSAVMKEVRYMTRGVISKHLQRFRPEVLSTMIDLCSSLNVLDSEFARTLSTHVASKIIEEPLYSKCALSLWMNSLWREDLLPNIALQNTCVSILENPIDLVDLSRLSWCVFNDINTKHDMQLTSRTESILKEKVASMSLPDLVETLSVSAPEAEIINRIAIQELLSRIADVGDLKGLSGKRIPAILLKAWTQETPSDTGFFNSILTRALRSGIAPYSVLESLAVLKPAIPMGDMSQFVLRHCAESSIEQLTSLALSTTVLGLLDTSTISHVAKQLQWSLLEQGKTDPMNMWKIGVWYCAISRSEVVFRAVQNAYPALCARIAAGMWDGRSEFVRGTEKIAPAERSLRQAVSKAFTGMGVTNVQGVHVVNTPFVVPIFLRDHQLALSFSDDELMTAVLENRGIRVKRVSVELWETKYMSESKEEFLASLLDLINVV